MNCCISVSAAVARGGNQDYIDITGAAAAAAAGGGEATLILSGRLGRAPGPRYIHVHQMINTTDLVLPG